MKKLYERINDPKEVAKIQEQIKAQFDAADKNHSGFLEFKELFEITVKAHHDAGLQRPDEAGVKRLLFHGDTNKDHKLSRDEYTKLVWEHIQRTADEERKKDEAERLKKEQAKEGDKGKEKPAH